MRIAPLSKDMTGTERLALSFRFSTCLIILFAIMLSSVNAVAPNITSYTPSNLTPIYNDSDNVTFNITVDQTVSYNWFKDGVLKAVTQFWNWLTGYDDYTTSNPHNITVLVNNSNGTDSLNWSVTISEVLGVPSTPTYSINGSYDYTILLSCSGTNQSESYYKIEANLTNWTTVVYSKEGTGVFDMSVVNYSQNIPLRCSACLSQSYNATNNSCSNYTYSSVTRVKRFTFILYPVEKPPYFSQIPYEFGIMGDVDNNNVSIRNAFVDCNGDNIYDYLFDSSNYWKKYAVKDVVSNFKNNFWCVFPKPILTEDNTITITAGMTFIKNASQDWPAFLGGCKQFHGDECQLIKQYPVFIEG